MSKDELCIIMEEFNARLGQRWHQTAPKTIGPQAVDSHNENGIRLLDFSLFNNCIVCNTFFNKFTTIRIP